MKNSSNDFHAQADPSSGKIQIVLKGYVPLTRNQLKGAHWSVETHEKKRAATALELALGSALMSLAIGQRTQMDGASSRLSTALSKLRSWMVTTGTYLKSGESVQKRFTRRKKKERASQ